ncbi:hypothetical protein KTAU_14940 [Thermogemmatispora aurantia]|uniref:Uncharacterized protein n=1 Tax=Thermogemmatispora aurantia TaxID=2045279 RepID=A0A5J4K878_9CHLR|nr:hypothetical protein KTAU_14940 [Thermogemmatispora aurantia]
MQEGWFKVRGKAGEKEAAAAHSWYACWGLLPLLFAVLFLAGAGSGWALTRALARLVVNSAGSMLKR